MVFVVLAVLVLVAAVLVIVVVVVVVVVVVAVVVVVVVVIVVVVVVLIIAVLGLQLTHMGPKQRMTKGSKLCPPQQQLPRSYIRKWSHLLHGVSPDVAVGEGMSTDARRQGTSDGAFHAVVTVPGD